MTIKRPPAKPKAQKPRVQGISFPNGGIEKLVEICAHYDVSKSEAVRQLIDAEHVKVVKAKAKAAAKRSVAK